MNRSWNSIQDEKGYFQNLHGYTLPLVIEALQDEKVGLPRSIKNIDNLDQRGPLMVTLATDLACVLVTLLEDQLRKNRFDEEQENLIKYYGGHTYIIQKNRIDKINELLIDVINKGIKLEDYLIKNGIAGNSFTSGGPGETIACINGDYLRNLKSLTKNNLSAEEKIYWEEYKGLVKTHDKLLKERKKLQKIVKHKNARLSKKPTFGSDLKERAKKEGIQEHKRDISFRFYNLYHILDDGASGILRKKDPIWWDRFTSYITHKINVKYRGAGRIQIYLRHSIFTSNVCRAFKNETTGTFDDFLIKALKNPKAYVHLDLAACQGKNPKGINDEDIRATFSRLRQIDTSVQTWIKQEGGEFHPSNIIEEHMNKSIFNKMSLKHNKYSLAQAQNELYWCLSRFNQDLFRPVTNSGYTISKWKKWVRAATKGRKVTFWKRKSIVLS